MSVVVVASAHGSPGVTTAAHLLASEWPSGGSLPVIVEADASGGTCASRHGLGLSPGMVTLVESLRKGERPAVVDHAQRLPSGIGCVALSPSATAAATQLRTGAPHLLTYLSRSGHPVVLDVGRVLPSDRLATSLPAAEHMLWLVKPLRDELVALRYRIAETPQPRNAAVVLVGDGPYRSEHVAAAVGLPVVHTLPDDPRAAAALTNGGDDRYLRRSRLARSCRSLAAELAANRPNQDEVKPATAGGAREGSPHQVEPSGEEMVVWRTSEG